MQSDNPRFSVHLCFYIICAIGISACSGGDSEDNATSLSDDTSSSETVDNEAIQTSLDPDLFLAAGLAESITTTACTLTDGTQTECFKVVINGAPANADIGPFCPRNITDDATQGGVWFDGSGELYQVDGSFILSLPDLYGSDWQLYDEATGEVFVTDSQIACEAAARPDVDPEYQNHCVECSIDYYDGGVTQTLLIPVEPVALANPNSLSADLGVSLNGVVIAGPAPVNAILSANTIAAFDDCGGHVNPAEGYHYHAALGCSDVISSLDGHANILGYALDGYGIYAMLNSEGEEDFDLDECRGHSDETRGYHYHAASAAENMFIGCFKGAQGSITVGSN
ncbi:YHYH protein [Alteromonas portus]|uniref:YHYH protein n=1 Tax=Alteromonas portus TaxID=2565549 RepID=A0A4U0ZH49_9ALTE|nr:YHYH protein [Alteromonas portus]TKB02340.1 YHYH protein [Alteromonas portus]